MTESTLQTRGGVANRRAWIMNDWEHILNKRRCCDLSCMDYEWLRAHCKQEEVLRFVVHGLWVADWCLKLVGWQASLRTGWANGVVFEEARIGNSATCFRAFSKLQGRYQSACQGELFLRGVNVLAIYGLFQGIKMALSHVFEQGRLLFQVWPSCEHT